MVRTVGGGEGRKPTWRELSGMDGPSGEEACVLRPSRSCSDLGAEHSGSKVETAGGVARTERRTTGRDVILGSALVLFRAKREPTGIPGLSPLPQSSTWAVFLPCLCTSLQIVPS